MCFFFHKCARHLVFYYTHVYRSNDKKEKKKKSVIARELFSRVMPICFNAPSGSSIMSRERSKYYHYYWDPKFVRGSVKKKKKKIGRCVERYWLKRHFSYNKIVNELHRANVLLIYGKMVAKRSAFSYFTFA